MNDVETITMQEAYRRLSQNPNRIMRVDFIKRTNGEYRKMICRQNVHKGVTGKGLSFDPESKGLLIVYDMEKAAFRSINLRDMKWIRIDGKEARIND